jgi:hypothetical protein
MINYVDRVALSVASKPISEEFGLSKVAMGYLFSSFLWTYLLCLLPMGDSGRSLRRQEVERRRHRTVVGRNDADRRGLELRLPGCDSAGDGCR